MMSCPKCGHSPTPECQAPSSPSAHFILVRGVQLIPGFRIIFSIPAARGDGAISTCKEGGGDRNPPSTHILPPLMPTALGLCRNNPRCQRSCTPQFCWGWQFGGFWPGPSKPPGVWARQAPCGAAPKAPLPRLVPRPWPDSPKPQPGCCPSAGLARKLLPWPYVQGCTSACLPPPASRPGQHCPAAPLPGMGGCFLASAALPPSPFPKASPQVRSLHALFGEQGSCCLPCCPCLP